MVVNASEWRSTMMVPASNRMVRADAKRTELKMFFVSTFLRLVQTETDDRNYTFVYNESYIDSGNPSISVNLPKSRKEFSSPYLFPFFTNLLPEGANKRYICRRNRIDEHDLMGLLSFFAGRDFIGSIGVENIG